MEHLFYYGMYPPIFAFGVITHIVFFKNVEIDVYIPHLVGGTLLAFCGLTSAYLLNGLSASATIYAVLVQSICFCLGVWTSMIIYRLAFHRIRSFPGPVLAKTTRFYNLYLSSKRVQYHRELEKIHKKYGDVARTGPREISILRKAAVPLIYGPQSQCVKGTWYSQVSYKSENAQLFFSRDVADHKRRKRAWDRGFSVKALSTYQPRIKAKVDMLINEFRNSVGTPKDATAWMMMLSFDIMGEVGYSKDFGSVSSGKEHAAAKAIHDHMTILGVLSATPWLLYMLQFIPRATAGYAPFFAWCASMITEKKSTFDPDEYPQDISTWIIKAVMERDISASPTVKSLSDDARLIIIAGSDTSASANACTLYYLAKYPHVLRKLQAALDAAMPRGARDWDYDKVLSVTYVDDVIRESLRLKPPVITGAYRTTPSEGIQVDEVYIPGDINVIVPFQLLHIDERYFERPNEFIPERWGERKEAMGTDESLLIPFGGGIYKCPGDKLAMMGMRTVVSSIVQEFDIAFAPGESGESFEADRKDAFTTVLPPLSLTFTSRSK